jgi:hypothetical protein
MINNDANGAQNLCVGQVGDETTGSPRTEALDGDGMFCEGSQPHQKFLAKRLRTCVVVHNLVAQPRNLRLWVGQVDDETTGCPRTEALDGDIWFEFMDTWAEVLPSFCLGLFSSVYLASSGSVSLQS